MIRKNVIFLDDELAAEEGNFNCLTHLIKMDLGEFYQFHNFSDPIKCWNFIKENSQTIVAVFSDYVMPKIDGISFLDEIPNIDKDIECVLVTGWEDIDGELKNCRFKVLDKKLVKDPEIEKQKQSIYQKLFSREFKEQLSFWLIQKRKDAIIQINKS